MASATANDPSSLADPNTAKAPKQAIGLMLAHRAIMEEDLRATLSDSRSKARAWWQNKGAAGIQGEGPMNVPPEPDMGDIHIGDINYAPPAPPAPPANSAPSITASPAAPAPVAPASTPAPAAATPIASGLSNLAKAAVVASAMLGGGGIGAVATSLLSQPSVSVSVPPQNVPNNEPLLQFFKPSNSTPANGSSNG